MAKSQKKSNREVKKPKAKKTAAAAPAIAFLSKAAPAPGAAKKKA